MIFDIVKKDRLALHDGQYFIMIQKKSFIDMIHIALTHNII